MSSPFVSGAQPFERSDVETEVSRQGCQVDRFTMYSPSMDRDIKVVVVLPPAYAKEDKATFPILYTLHGYQAPYDTWAVMPKLHQQLQKTPFIYTCFDGDIASFYIDSFYPVKTQRKQEIRESDVPKTSKFMTFFFDEFIPAIDTWYRVNADKRAVTGFSMGGCGAMTYGLAHPEMFSSISGLSSTYMDFSDPKAKASEWMPDYLGSMDEFPERYEALDHYKLIDKHLASGVKLPPIYQHIGSEDFLVKQNRKFERFAQEKGIDVTYEETPGGHNWKFWHPASVGVAEFHWTHWQD
ncbi:alpha/beta hydrolase [Cerasicoccus maritimus]|uniref:alpha/beta hydrolase n=1 Tax=Cerasicoccus maritimus TaxID=490089 RepID=UPI0028529A49|nr:alpha/beta hydrolase-fold protein [Cerasicoccus maritimus]